MNVSASAWELAMLQESTPILKAQMWFSDHVCRCEGDRFALILPETGSQPMGAIAEKIHRDLSGVEYGEGRSRRSPAAAVAAVLHPQNGYSETCLPRALRQRLQEQKIPQTAGAR